MLLVVFLLAAGAVLSLTAFFKIEAVSVVGTDKYPPEEIARASGIEVGQNLFRVSGSKVETALMEQYPYIESIELHRKLPPAIEIEIKQARPEAAVVEEDAVVLITQDGKVLERGRMMIPAGVPAVQGLNTEGAQPGTVLGEDAKDGLRMLEYLCKAINDTGFSQISNIDITNPLNMTVVYENRLLLKLGTEADLEHKLRFIQKVLDRIGDDAQGRLDVSNLTNSSKGNYKRVSLQEALELEKKGDNTNLVDNSASAGDLPENEEMSGNPEQPEIQLE